MSLKLFTVQGEPITNKILIAAKYAGVAIDLPAYNHGKDNKTDAFLKANPIGKVPVLETSKGSIFESDAIATYVARQHATFGGTDAVEQAQIQSWLCVASHEIELAANVWTYPILGRIPDNKVATSKAKATIRNVLDSLNKFLQARTYFVGERVTLADIALATSLQRLYELVLEPSFRKAFINVNRWFTTIVNQPNVKAVLGEVKLCEKAQVAPEAPAAAEGEAAEKPAAGKKEAKPKEPAKPKEAPKPKPKPKDEDEDEIDEFESDAGGAPKAKNPLDLLPPSKFILDEWKRVYSNQDTRKEAIPWFWKNLDREGYSLWRCSYKYNSELTQIFMTCNLVGGFIQRLDPLRKYGFASFIIFGENNNSEIHGVFLVRGKDQLPKEVTECDDYETFDFVKLNPENSNDVELFNDFLAWDGSFGGVTKLAFNQGKCFK